MITPDTNILSTFARIDALDLLFVLFAKDEISIVPAVYAEVVAGVNEGHLFLHGVIQLVAKGRLKLLALTPEEVVQRLQLPPTLNAGEAESITVCRSRGAAFVTND